jgi:Ca2+-binding RTX toxin-like protein
VQMEGNTLAVGGTLGNDTIILSPADTTGHINVNLNGVSQGSFLPTDHILVYGQSGNDTIQLATRTFGTTVYYITVPAFLYGGGTGHDVLDASGSSANNVLVGGAGRNDLFGGLGRDLLIAGLGASKLHAGSADDILIGGWTNYDLTSTAMTYDRKLTGLEAIMAEWGRTDADYLTRVHHLDGSVSGGLNGSFFLNTTTVHDNGVVDRLFGAPGSALDWFFAGASDKVKHKRNGEILTSIS